MTWSKPHRLYIALASLLATGLVGCGAAQYPMVTSLGDLRSERRLSESYDFYFEEIITLDGTNPTQMVGRPIHYGKPYEGIPTQLVNAVFKPIWPLWQDRDLNPSTAFPMEHVKPADSTKPDDDRNDTYRRIGWCDSPGQRIVREIAKEIDKVQVYTLALVDLRIQLAQAQLKDEGDDALEQIRSEITKVRENIVTGRANIHKLLNGQNTNDFTFTDKEKKNKGTGILIVRWAASETGGLSLNAGDDFGSGSFQAGRRRSGYVVLGGITVSQLVVGNDLLRDLRMLHAGEIKGLETMKKMLDSRKLGLTMFVLRAKDIAYASDLQAEFAARLNAQLSKSNLSGVTKLDKITIQAELAQAADLSNIGALPGLNWRTKPYKLGYQLMPDQTFDAPKNKKNAKGDEGDEGDKPVDAGDDAAKLDGDRKQGKEQFTATLNVLSPEKKTKIDEVITINESVEDSWSTIYSVVAYPKQDMLRRLHNMNSDQTRANGSPAPPASNGG